MYHDGSKITATLRGFSARITSITWPVEQKECAALVGDLQTVFRRFDLRCITSTVHTMDVVMASFNMAWTGTHRSSWHSRRGSSNGPSRYSAYPEVEKVEPI
jgi:hypothetical protein